MAKAMRLSNLRPADWSKYEDKVLSLFMTKEQKKRKADRAWAALRSRVKRGV